MSSGITEPVVVEASGRGRLWGLVQVPWALLDQMLISATNFVTIVYLARGFTKEALGNFTLVYSALLFVNSVQSGLITQAHNILGATRQGEDYRVYTTSTAIGQVLLSLIAAAVAMAAWGVAVPIRPDIAALLLALAPAIIGWQFQEFTRRVLYTEGRVAAAFATDLLGYGGQALIIRMLYMRQMLTGPMALHVLTVASAAGGLLGLWCIRRSLVRRVDVAALWENWHFGKWITGGDIVGHWLSAQMFVYLSAGMLGAAAAGVLRAVHTLFGPSRVLSEMLYNVLPIRFSKTLAGQGPRSLHRQVVLAHLVAIPALGGYCLLVAVFAGPLLVLLYHNQYAGSGSVLRTYALAAFASYMTMIVAAALRAKRRTRELFRGQLWASIIAVPVGWVLIRLFGIYGTVLGMLFSYFAMAVLFWLSYAEDAEPSAVESDSAEGDDGGARLPSDAESGAGELLVRVFELLDRAGIAYCVTHGYEDYPQRVRSDVDMIMPAADVRGRLPALLRDNRHFLGASIVQWVHEDTDYIVLAGQDSAGRVRMVRLDISTDYVLSDRMFLSGAEVLASRKRYREFWIPSTEVEFGCCIVRRAVKRTWNRRHTRRLSELYASDPAGCRRQIRKYWKEESARLIERAAASGDWGEVRLAMRGIRSELLRRAALAQPLKLAGRWTARQMKRMRRWRRPGHGLHIVLLGPDGAGKSSVTAALRQDLGPAFFAYSARTFPPALLNRGDPGMGNSPHSLPMRSPAASVIRALGYWLVYHTVGYLPTVHAELARCQLVVHDRHLVDALVDPKRYRYSGPVWLLRAIWRAIPKPDLVIVLDAPAETIRSRKREVPAEETARQCAAYAALAAELPMGRTVNAGQPLSATVADVERVILRYMTARASWQLGLDRPDKVPGAVRRVLGRVGAGTRGAWIIEKMGSGDQAEVYQAMLVGGGPRGQQDGTLVVKMFKEVPEADLAVEEEYESLRRLHGLLNGTVIDGWRVHVPEPVLRSRKPRAIVMSMVPGRPLNSILSSGRTGSGAVLDSAVRAVHTALARYWEADGRIYGDLDLNNILCDPEARLLAFVDPGMPERAYLASAAGQQWFPASRDLAYFTFDVAASVKAAILNPPLRRRQQRMVAAMLGAALERLGSDEAKQSVIGEISDCGRAHLGRIDVSWSPAGICHRLVRWAAAIAMKRMLRGALAGTRESSRSECRVAVMP